MSGVGGVIDILRRAGVATVHEAQGRTGLMDTGIHPIQQGTAIAGTAVTVLCDPGDNLGLHRAIEHCQAGDVLVLAMSSPNTDGLLGELLATSLHAHGVVGAVVDCGVRDVAVLRGMGFAVWSRAVCAQGTTKSSPGAVNVAVVCAGQAVEPGDIVVADDDGVVCVARADASAIAQRVAERVAHEEAIRERLVAGELSLDILGLRGS